MINKEKDETKDKTVINETVMDTSKSTRNTVSIFSEEKPNLYEPRVITLKTKNNTFGFHLKGPLKSGSCMRYLNGRFYPPLHYVYSMDEYSCAIKSGLKIYDTILEINDNDVTGLSYNCVNEILKFCEEKKEIKLKVMYPDSIETVKEFCESSKYSAAHNNYVENEKHTSKSVKQANHLSNTAPKSYEMLDKVQINSMLEREKNAKMNNLNFYLRPIHNRSRSNCFSDDNIVNIICIPVVRFIKTLGNECAFYDIYQGERYLVSRRYNDFKAYHKHMKLLIDDFPSLPSGWNLFMTNSQIDSRRIDLEKYIKKICESLILLKLAPTRLFLGLGAVKYNDDILPLCDPFTRNSSDDENDNDSVITSNDGDLQDLYYESEKKKNSTRSSKETIISSLESLNMPTYSACDKNSTKFLISVRLPDNSYRLPIIAYETETAKSVFIRMCKEYNFPKEALKYFAFFHCPTPHHGGVVLRQNCIPFQIFLQNYIHQHNYSLYIKRWSLETDHEDVFLKIPLLVNILYAQLTYDVHCGNLDEHESTYLMIPTLPDQPTKIKVLKTARNFSSYATFRVNIDSLIVSDMVYNNCVTIISPYSVRFCLDSETDRTTIFSFNINDVGKPIVLERDTSAQQTVQLQVNDGKHQYTIELVTSNLGYLLRCLKKAFKTRESMSIMCDKYF